MTRDIDWGIPVPLPGWEDNPTKRLYVWFDAVIGYLSASIEWARRTRRPRRVARRGGTTPRPCRTTSWARTTSPSTPRSGRPSCSATTGAGRKGGAPGQFGTLNLPTEVVSSEFLTMEGKQFSSSRGVVIYVRDMLSRYQPDALRYFISVAGPENQDTDFTWAEFKSPHQRRARRRLGQPGQPHGDPDPQELRRDPGAGRAPAGRPGPARDDGGGLRHGRRAARHATATAPRSARRCAWSRRPTSTSPRPSRGS